MSGNPFQLGFLSIDRAAQWADVSVRTMRPLVFPRAAALSGGARGESAWEVDGHRPVFTRKQALMPDLDRDLRKGGAKRPKTG